MTLLRRLKVQNFRTHQAMDITIHDGVTLITGSNGSGKTSLIEAIYIALRGSSFRGADLDIVRHSSEWWRIDLLSDDQTTRSVLFDSSKSTGRKRFIIDSKTTYRLPQKHKSPVVLFEPDDLRLLHGSPARRRLFIDSFIGQLDPTYTSTLHKYERGLKQRNNLLKKPYIADDELFVWDLLLSEYGYEIIQKRVYYTTLLQSELELTYNSIAHTDDEVKIHYSHDISQQKLLADLHDHHMKDKLLGNTSVGPHRHDIEFIFNTMPATSVASRGEIRSIVLALKFLEVKIIETNLGQKPIILLDDVYSELDETRRHKLVDSISEYQVIMTNTHGLPEAKTYNHIELN
ncbi:MAG: DNA replication and repair protein RecF [Candidatus Saccharimonadales bacterium]